MKKFILISLLFVIHSNAQQKLEIYFNFGKSELTNKSKTTLDSLLSIRKNIEIRKIYGFADAVDTDKYNDSLSLKRAKTIANYFSSQNLKLNKTIEIKGFGEKQSTKNLHLNRKVIIYFNTIESPKVNPNNSENSRFNSAENREQIKKFLESEKSISEKFRKAKKEDIIIINNIQFELNSEKLALGSEEIVIELFEYLKNNPKLKIEILGHICCNRNTNDVKLSYRRAKFIFDYLIKNGIATGRLGYRGFGSVRPIYKIPEKTFLEEFENRRVEILVIEI
jgi:outer membrane protein OmpA-like peptidoglycan-associated protein